MITANEILLSRSNPVVNALSSLSDIKAVLCFGSYAMGTFDQYSDIDFYVFCHPEIALSAARREVFQLIGGVKELQMDYQV